MLKKYFPVSYRAKDVTGLIVSIIIYLVIGLVAGLIMFLADLIFGWIPILGTILTILLSVVGWIIEAYCTAGIVIAVLVMLDIIK